MSSPAPRPRNRNKPWPDELDRLYAHVVSEANPVWQQDVKGIAQMFEWPVGRVRQALALLVVHKRLFRTLNTFSSGRYARQNHEVHAHEGQSKAFIDDLRRRSFRPPPLSFFGEAQSPYRWPEALDQADCPLCAATLESMVRRLSDEQ